MECLVFVLLVLTGGIQGQSIITRPSDATEAKGATAKFICEVDYGHFPQMMNWKFNEEIIFSFKDGKVNYPVGTNKYTAQVTQDQKKFTLEVRNLEYSDGGKYMCQLMNSNTAAVLVVLGYPAIAMDKTNPRDGDTVVYTCEAQFGGPSEDEISEPHFPELKVFLDKNELPVTNPSTQEFHIRKAYEINVTAGMHSKELTCEIGTKKPRTRVPFVISVNVIYAVRNTSYSPKKTSYRLGESLTCDAIGNPSPTFEWRSMTTEESLTKGPLLRITEVMKGSNKWKCTARNNIDQEPYEDTITATFEAEPDVEHSITSTDEFNYVPLIIITVVVVAVITFLGYIAFLRTNTILKIFKEKVTGHFYITAAIVVFGNSFPHGWNTGVINIPQPFINDFLNTTFKERYGLELTSSSLEMVWATTVSVYLLGGILGVIFADMMNNEIGRRDALLLCHITGIISAILFGFCKMANSFEMLILGRLIVGIGCGASSEIVPVYLTEMVPDDVEKFALVLHQFALTCGILASQLFGIRQILGGESLWPILLVLTIIPCLVSAVWLPFLSKSPVYLVKQIKNGIEQPSGEKEEAEKALKKLRKGTDVEIEDMLKKLYDKHNENAMNPETAPKNDTICEKCMNLVTAPKKNTILVCSLAICQQLCGINIVFYYSVTVYGYSGLPADVAQYAVLATGVINVLMTGVSMICNMERRRLLIIGMAIMVICAILMICALHFQNFYICIAATVFFVIGFALQLGSLPQVIGAELHMKEGHQKPVMRLAGILNWAANFLVAFFFPIILMTTGPYSFTICITFLVGFGILFRIQLPKLEKTEQGIKEENQEQEEIELREPLNMGESPAPENTTENTTEKTTEKPTENTTEDK